MKTTKSKIWLSILAIMIGAVTIFWMHNQEGAQNGGTIEIIVIDEFGEIVIDDYVTFTATNSEAKKTTMRMILVEHYDIEIKQGMLIRIETVYADTREYFIKIWINCEPSLYGIDQMPFKDGDVIHFVHTKVGDMRAPC